MLKCIAVIVIVGLLSGGLWLVAQESKTDQARIEALIKRLGNDNWETREAAQNELIATGKRMIEAYREAGRYERRGIKKEIERLAVTLQEACQNKDPEINMRANQIRQSLYSSIRPRIIFVSQRGNKKRDIYLVSADGTNEQQLTDDQADDWAPAWKPDGAKIAFTSQRDGHSAIFVMNADGTRQRKLTDSSASMESPDWSPDGAKIVYQSRVGSKIELYVMDADGKNQQRLTHDLVFSTNPAWSPDGTKIAFECKESRNTDIYVMDANGENRRKLTDSNGSSLAPAWSPDSNKIIFSRFLSDETGLYVMDKNGKNQKKLVNTIVGNSFSWSPDGDKIVFALARPGNTTGPANMLFGWCYYELYTMDSNGKNISPLSVSNTNEHTDSEPSWNPVQLAEIAPLFLGPNQKPPDILPETGEGVFSPAHTAPLKPTKPDFLPLCAAQPTPWLNITDRIQIGDEIFPVELQADGEQVKIMFKDKEKPQKVIFESNAIVELPLSKYASGKYWIIIKRTGKEWSYCRAGGLSGKINDTLLIFVDENTNGIFNEIGVDGVIYPGSHYVIPLEEKMVVGRDLVQMVVSNDGKSVGYSATPIKGKDEYLKGMEALNQIRISAGIPPRPIDEELCRACELHAKYLILNPPNKERLLSAHDEDPTKPGYTNEGARAGQNSCIMVGFDSPESKSDIITFIDTFYHRLPLLDPRTEAFGFGIDGKNILCDGQTKINYNSKWQFPVIFPAPEQSEAGLFWLDDFPHPKVSGKGAFITLQFIWRPEYELKVVEARMVCQGEVAEAKPPSAGKGPLPVGAEIKIYSYDTVHPANSEEAPTNHFTILLVPETVLNTNSIYWVWIKYTYQGKEFERAWWFRTTSDKPNDQDPYSYNRWIKAK